MKKCKAWWIGGGVLGFVALLFATALLLESNSPEARLETVLNEIIDEIGSEPGTLPLPVTNDLSLGRSVMDAYRGAPIGPEDEKRFLAQLREACTSCTVDVYTHGENGTSVTAPTSEPTFNNYYWSLDGGTTICSFAIVFDDKGLLDEGDSPSSKLFINRYGERDRWAFLKRLWPW